MELDSNGCPMEGSWLGGDEVIVHYDDAPATDLTTVDGIPCTTALRTVIDIAADVDDDHLEQIVEDCLERRLFTVEEALARVVERDMRARPGAVRLRHLLSRIRGRQCG